MFYDAASLRGMPAFSLDAPPPGLVMTTFIGPSIGGIASDTALQGDFDDDGFDDLAIGVSGEDIGSGSGTVDNAGAIHVLFGGASGLTAIGDVTLFRGSGLNGAPQANEMLGAVLTAGDLNPPAGVVARERSRADRIHPGTLRRQRIALTTGADPATLAHWSVPEPPTEGDERAWRRALDRLADARPGQAGGGPRSGWSA